MRRVIAGAVSMILCAALIVGIGIIHNKRQVQSVGGGFANTDDNSAAKLTLWYCDNELADYFDAVINTYSSEKNVAVKAAYVSESEMLEKINSANINEDEAPADIYFVSSESLEKAFLAGLTETINDMGIFNADNFSETAIRACTYKDKMIAYPVCYETSMLAYNADYVDSAPKTFDDILSVAADDETELPESVESVLKWDVKSLQYNFGFAGGYLEFGGADGDDESVFDLNGAKVVEAMEYYYNLSQFFSIDINKADYDSVFEEFIDGKVMYTIVNSKSIKELDQSGLNYGLEVLPDLNGNLSTTALSLTTAAVINPYSESGEAAEDFIKYICYDNAGAVYDYSNYIPCADTEQFSSGKLGVVSSAYDKSASLPKLMSASDYWVYLEIAMNKVWSGEDIQQTMNSLEERMAE